MSKGVKAIAYIKVERIIESFGKNFIDDICKIPTRRRIDKKIKSVYFHNRKFLMSELNEHCRTY